VAEVLSFLLEEVLGKDPFTCAKKLITLNIFCASQLLFNPSRNS
jgi:hypothetical protein